MTGAVLLAAIWLQYIAPMRVAAPSVWIGVPTVTGAVTRVAVCVQTGGAGRPCEDLIFEGSKLIATQPATDAACGAREGG